jgi:hypothetical protein
MDDGNELGRNLSVHFPSHVKPLIIIGHVSLSNTVSKKTLGVIKQNAGIST